MPTPESGHLTDNFVLRFVRETSSADAWIGDATVDINPLGSGSQDHFVTIRFAYRSGLPPATAFDVSWSSDNPEAVLPSRWTFSPTGPLGGGNQMRIANLHVWVPTPTVRTRYVASITIRQP